MRQCRFSAGLGRFRTDWSKICSESGTLLAGVPVPAESRITREQERGHHPDYRLNPLNIHADLPRKRPLVATLRLDF